MNSTTGKIPPPALINGEMRRLDSAITGANTLRLVKPLDEDGNVLLFVYAHFRAIGRETPEIALSIEAVTIESVLGDGFITLSTKFFMEGAFGEWAYTESKSLYEKQTERGNYEI